MGREHSSTFMKLKGPCGPVQRACMEHHSSISKTRGCTVGRDCGVITVSISRAAGGRPVLQPCRQVEARIREFSLSVLM